jgi:hypothetical protein
MGGYSIIYNAVGRTILINLSFYEDAVSSSGCTVSKDKVISECTARDVEGRRRELIFIYLDGLTKQENPVKITVFRV